MTPWVLRIVVANVIIFVLSLAAPALVDHFLFVPVLILERPWTILTYMFLHANISHIFFNMLALFFFGPRLEIVLGERRFLLLYFISGISGGVLSCFFMPQTPILGASGAVYGIMLGFAYFWPRELIYIWGLLPVQSRWLIIIMTILSLFGGIGVGEGGVAHFAHLGGFLGGYLYLVFAKARPEELAAPKKEATIMPSAEELTRWMSIRKDKLHVVNREELERILAKIGKDGPASVTAREREFLDRFSRIEQDQ
jgi:membrane associated rhomboid family serine protease